MSDHNEPPAQHSAPATPVLLQAEQIDAGPGSAQVLRGWTAQFPAGLSLILGEDGAGKTTALRVLAGELAPRGGRIRWRGGPPPGAGEVFWRDPQEPWPEALSPRGWAAQLRTQWPQWSQRAWERHVDGFDLQMHLSKPMYQLSTGGRRKVLLAAALASGAPLTLIDEPVAALDRASIDYLCEALDEAAQAAAEARRALILAHYDRLDEGLPWQCVAVLPLAQ